MSPEVEQVQEAFSFWRDIFKPVVLPAIGAFLGVLAKEAIDRRKSKRQYGIRDAEFLCSQIDEVRELSLSYWSEDANHDSKIIEARITGMLHGCTEIIEATNLGTELDKTELRDTLRAFRKVCTSGSFGQANRAKDLTRLEEIEIEARTFYAKVLTFRRG